MKASVKQVLAEGKAHLDHDDQGPKLHDDADDADEQPTPDDPSYDAHAFVDSDDHPGFCDVCDQDEGAAVHTTDSEPAMT